MTPDSSSPQSFVAFTFDSAQPAGTVVSVVDADGTVLATFTASKQFSSLVYSSPDVAAGAQLQAMVGGTAAGESVGGLSTEGDATGATAAATATAGEFTGGGMGRPGGGRPGG